MKVVIRNATIVGSIALAMLLLSTQGWAQMTLVDPGLAGNTVFDEWSNDGLRNTSNPGFPGYPGTGAWPSSIGSDVLGSGDAVLNKTGNGAGGGPYPYSGGGLYFGGTSSVPNTLGGSLSITDASPIAGIEAVTFQIQVGEALGYDFYNNALPTLSYNGGAQNLAPDATSLLEQFPAGTFPVPGGGTEPLYTNTYLLEWDLSGVVGSIADFQIDWSNVQHARIYTMRLDQSDTFAVAAAVPEPSSLLVMLMGIGAAAAAWCMRRRRATK